jgi:P4 family phage/plasmid primase-like protien
VETWTTAGKKENRIDYDGICYHRLGIRNRSGEWVPYLPTLESFLTHVIERSAVEKTNSFFGVAPRYARGDSATYELAWQIRTIRALWSDIDDTPDVATAVAKCGQVSLPPPSIVVSSGHGAHLYWLLDSPYLIDDYDPPAPYPVFAEFHDQGEGKKKAKKSFYLNGSPERLYLDVPTHKPHLSPKARYIQDALSGIAVAVGGDHTHDLTRILRLPDTLNRKNERNGTPPIPCTLVSCDPSCRYPLSLFAKFANTSPQKIDRERIAKIPLPRPKTSKPGVKDLRRIDSLIADCLAADTGTRSEADFALCCWGVEQGMPPDFVWNACSHVGKFAESGRRYFDLTWDAACSHTREKLYTAAKVKIAQREEQKEKATAKGPESEELTEANDDPHRLARVNLEHYATFHDGRTLRYWRSEWYTWKDNRYQKLTEDEFRAKLSFFIREEFERIAREKGEDENGEPAAVQKVSMALVSNVMQATSGMPAVCVSSNIEPGTWLPTRERRKWVSMKNGILDIDAVLANSNDYLRPNNPEWFSPVSLPYAFDPEATCPRFAAFLEHNLELDPERIKILQEWAGYLLLPDTGEQKFIVLEGEGANGKSVFISALTAMLGPENVANVPLEKFGDRFSLTTTLGKLLNAAGDCGDIDRSAEGDLKSFTGGDRMFFDRKGIPGLECAPTARLIIACNNRPRFSDRSQGIWRRMLLIPWRIQIDREKRVHGMDKVDWWQNSGELPGIFRWALLGLARLRAQRGFTESAVMAEALKDYQEEMNPARVFLQENLESERDHAVRAKVVYKIYRKWCDEAGHKPLADKNFGKEIKRVFPSAERKHAGTRDDRFWIYDGMKFCQEEICGEKTEDAKLF